ncbi:MAG: hypothetical protein ABIB47_01610 [Candidatus Woesearchaeota archaeon]
MTYLLEYIVYKGYDIAFFRKEAYGRKLIVPLSTQRGIICYVAVVTGRKV